MGEDGEATTVRLKKDTYERIAKYGGFHETTDEVLTRILDSFEGVKKGKR